MGFFRNAKNSFSNFDSYCEIAVQGVSKTFKYFFILFTLIFIVQGIKFGISFHAGVTEFTSTVRDKVPEFSLSGGQLKVEAKQPLIFDGDNNTALFIDTTGQLSESVLDKYNEGVFVSQDKIVNKQGLEKQEIKFADFKQFSLNKEQLMNVLPKIKWLIVLIGIFGYIFSGAWVLITTVILGLLGLMINSTLKGKLIFNQTWTIAVYAMTLPLLLELLVNLVYPALPYFWVMKWGLALYLMYKAIEAVIQHSGPGELPPPPGELV